MWDTNEGSGHPFPTPSGDRSEKSSRFEVSFSASFFDVAGDDSRRELAELVVGSPNESPNEMSEFLQREYTGGYSVDLALAKMYQEVPHDTQVFSRLVEVLTVCLGEASFDPQPLASVLLSTISSPEIDEKVSPSVKLYKQLIQEHPSVAVDMLPVVHSGVSDDKLHSHQLYLYTLNEAVQYQPEVFSDTHRVELDRYLFSEVPGISIGSLRVYRSLVDVSPQSVIRSLPVLSQLLLEQNEHGVLVGEIVKQLAVDERVSNKELVEYRELLVEALSIGYDPISKQVVVALAALCDGHGDCPELDTLIKTVQQTENHPFNSIIPRVVALLHGGGS